MSVPGPIFIVGMPRSGTTLLQALITAHPEISIAPETHFLRRWSGVEEDFASLWASITASGRIKDLGLDLETLKPKILDSADYTPRNIFEILLREFAKQQGKPRWGEKTPKHFEHVETLIRWFPHCSIIWLVRDPRAVCNSFMEVYWRAIGRSGLKRLEPGWIARARRAIHDASLWQKHVDALRVNWAADPHVRVIRYEDLTQDPLTCLSTLEDFLDVHFDEQSLSSRSWESISIAPAESLADRRGGEWLQQHYTRAVEPVTQDRVYSWKQNLRRAEVKLIESICGSGMAHMGYTPSEEGLTGLRDRMEFELVSKWGRLYWGVKGRGENIG